MKFTYHCQVHANDRKNKIVKIPYSTVIATDYLFGFSCDEFIEAFSLLQEIAISIYGDMINDPEGYGLKLTPAYTDGAVNLVNCFGNILYAMGLYGELNNHNLIVNLESYKKTVSKHKYNKVQKKMCDFGFLFIGFNGKVFDKGITEFSVSYLDSPNIMIAIKALAIATKPFIDNATTDKYYVDDIFNLFSYRPLEDKSTHAFETMFYMMTDYFSNSAKEVIYIFHDKLKELNFKYQNLYGSIQYWKSGSRRISFSYSIENDCFGGRIIFDSIARLVETLKKSGERIRSPFFNSSCHFCGGQSDPGKKCPKRVVHEIDGTTYYNCKMICFVFDNIQLQDINELINLIKIEYKVL